MYKVLYEVDGCNHRSGIASLASLVVAEVLEMNPTSAQQDMRSHRKSPDLFLLLLAVLAMVASAILLRLLNIEDLGLGYRVVLAGVGGIVGSNLSPLLEQRSPFLEQRSENESKESTGADMAPLRIWASTFVRLLVHAAGGFGCAAAGFIVTSALLSANPGNATSELGIAAFGGGVGYLAGREINRRSLSWTSDEAETSPAVVTALGALEDQLFGQPLLNYDGHVVASWHASTTSSETLGQIHVHLEAPKVREERENLVNDSQSESAIKTTQPLSSGRALVVIEGGRDADPVPFAISIISGTFDIQPRRIMIRAPTEGASETRTFTVLTPQQSREDQGSIIREVSREVRRLGVRTFSRLDSELTTATVLIDVSQAGQTVQLLELEISFP